MTRTPWEPHPFTPYPEGHAWSGAKGCLRCGQAREHEHHVEVPEHPRVTGLPGSPKHGETVVYINNGTEWTVRYDEPTREWEFLEGGEVPA